MGQSSAEVIALSREKLAQEGWPPAGDVVSGGAVTASFLVQVLLYGKQFGLLGPDSKVLLEDPKYLTPWEVRAVRIEDGNLVLDVWGH